ncbi:hypothetical protein N7520_005064 [Penicillium odoratum]|uniref:uncharacterized protein n=1 Tax=Penicillium odoratum TaxID=1167516 RepID=UPI002546D6F3|nr:uncharacterized protein N7520_005064 [Penicillium odoratum]KAJ5765505.1 hypothetical protein N7520_005064 [Penicillium odoratum]
MHWKKSTLFMATGIDCALATRRHLHGHGHGHAHLMLHAEKLEPRDLAWADQIPADMLIEFRTLTTTIYEDCAPTNTVYITTTTIEDMSKQTHLLPKPSLAVKQSLSEKPEATTTVHMTKTVMDIVVETPPAKTIGSVPEYGDTDGRIDNVTAPSPEVALETTRTGIHSTTTVTSSLSGFGNATVTVALNVTEPSREAPAREAPEREAPAIEAPAREAPIRGTARKSPPKGLEGKEATIEGHLIPEPTPIDPAPGILPTLPGLPQLLPATAIPNINSIGQALDLNGHPLPKNIRWSYLPKDSEISTKGFGGRSTPKGSAVKYCGNVGIPWGSNIIAVSPTEAHRYKYVARFTGSNTEPWTVTIWNKVGPDGKMDGWYGHSALTFVLAPGETRYVAFDEDSEGAWGAAPGTTGLPVDQWGGYTSTWGEFSFGDGENSGWSGWDVSAIQAQLGHDDVQGMRICQADGKGCSIIEPNARRVVNAYTQSERHYDGIGGAAAPGPVRLVVNLDYRGVV